jgi:hypothetical protein
MKKFEDLRKQDEDRYEKEKVRLNEEAKASPDQAVYPNINQGDESGRPEVKLLGKRSNPFCSPNPDIHKKNGPCFQYLLLQYGLIKDYLHSLKDTQVALRKLKDRWETLDEVEKNPYVQRAQRMDLEAIKLDPKLEAALEEAVKIVNMREDEQCRVMGATLDQRRQPRTLPQGQSPSRSTKKRDRKKK